MSARIPVLLSKTPYEVIVGEGILSRVGEFIRQVLPTGKCALITDSNVAPLYGDILLDSLKKSGIETVSITIPAGEKSKSLGEVEKACDQMIAAGLDRGAFVAALGGGVVGDLAGFVASIYYRGIPHVQIPTTVVAQVDSSIGGKTGVNSREGKNLLGAFHQPALVVSDPATLSTLPKREFNEGMAEVIKHAVIRDEKMLEDLPDFSQANLPTLIARNVKIKARIVADDELEKEGIRALLNFGHTIGHAIENAAGYGRFLHGEAISLGLAAALDLSVKKAALAIGEAQKVIKILEAFDLPVKLPEDLSTDALIGAVRRDKKFQSGAIRFVLSSKLGSAFVSDDITESDIRQAIEDIRQWNREP
jgi:3-dehydroquinate synthase